MKRLLRAAEVLAWAGFFALAVLVLAVRFWVLPDIERYRQDIVAAMSRGLGLPVRVGAIQARWFGLRPHIWFGTAGERARIGSHKRYRDAIASRVAAHFPDCTMQNDISVVRATPPADAEELR